MSTKVEEMKMRSTRAGWQTGRRGSALPTVSASDEAGETVRASMPGEADEAPCAPCMAAGEPPVDPGGGGGAATLPPASSGGRKTSRAARVRGASSTET